MPKVEPAAKTKLGRATVLLGEGKNPSKLSTLFEEFDLISTYHEIMTRYSGPKALEVMGQELAGLLCPDELTTEELYHEIEESFTDTDS